MAADKVPEKRGSTAADVRDFLNKVAAAPKPVGTGRRGRLLFALDATASRQPLWDRAARITAEMFLATAALGGLDVQLAFYRGLGEFMVGRWTADAEGLARSMTGVQCLAGETQLRKVLKHAVNETKKDKVNALVFIGDAFEEDVDAVGAVAGELGLLGTPAFMFHEGRDEVAAFAFQQVAKLTGGAYCRFDTASADVLKDLLGAVAAYAAGGRPALEDRARRQGGAVLAIADQMGRK